MSDFYVYAHYTLDTNELFYIGKGKDKRAFDKTGRNQYWHYIVGKHGIRVEIVIDNLTEERAFVQEILGIEECKPKANFTKGGLGGYTGPNSGNFKASHEPWNKGKKCPEIGLRQLGVNNPVFGKSVGGRKVVCVEQNKTFNSVKELCKEVKISRSAIFNYFKTGKPVKGLNFKYV